MAEQPKIDDVDSFNGKPIYSNYAEYEAARDKWNRGKTKAELFGWVVIAVMIYGGWIGISKAYDYFKGSHATAVAAPDPRDEQIKQLAAQIEELKAKPVEHHYELRSEGLRTFRFDPATGDSCIQLTTKEDWKNHETMRQSCPYVDFIAAGPIDGNTYNQAECLYANNKKACDALLKPTATPTHP